MLEAKHGVNLAWQMPASRHTGAFVYEGSGRRQPADAPIEQRLCKELAIELQRCMARNNHKQERCTEAIGAWRRCCELAKQQQQQQQQQQQT